jgi:hypothetical protein
VQSDGRFNGFCIVIILVTQQNDASKKHNASTIVLKSVFNVLLAQASKGCDDSRL